MQLRADNVADWDPALFEKADTSSDALFYLAPRKVVHIDEGAIAAVTQIYRELLPPGGAILDLMSSWRSHLPAEGSYRRVAGLGLNAAEMADNPQLTDFVVHDLNAAPRLPFDDREFDAAVCCVSVQYLQQPVAVFYEVGRVLRPHAPLIVTFSNRCFPSKAVNLWRYTDDEQHQQIVALYFAAAEQWCNVTVRVVNPPGQQSHDPLYGVWGHVK